MLQRGAGRSEGNIIRSQKLGGVDGVGLARALVKGQRSKEMKKEHS